MRISLVLSSYNGSEYIDEQLDSLRLQDRTFDEVLICDDCSTDGTYDIIRSYIDHFKLEKWSVAVNAVNNGWKVNFHKLIMHATGDLIFLCDQDDVWLPSKVSEMAFLMENHPEIDVLACDVEPFYETGSKRFQMSETAPMMVLSCTSKLMLNRYTLPDLAALIVFARLSQTKLNRSGKNLGLTTPCFGSCPR